jgi:hypothetical protein
MMKKQKSILLAGGKPRPLLSLVEALALASKIAPIVRDGRVKAKRIRTVDKDGNVVRELDGLNYQLALAARQDVEIDGGNPKWDVCPCGRVFKPAKKSLGVCEDCKRQTVCAGWGGPCPTLQKPTPKAFWGSKHAKRGGEPWLCKACAYKKRSDTITDSQKIEIVRRLTEGRKAMTPAQRSEHSRKVQASLTPAQRSESRRKGHASSTPDQRRLRGERIKRGLAKMTPDQIERRARAARVSIRKALKVRGMMLAKSSMAERREMTRRANEARRTKTIHDEADVQPVHWDPAQGRWLKGTG